MKTIFVVLGFACIFLPVEGLVQHFKVRQEGPRNEFTGGNSLGQTVSSHSRTVVVPHLGGRPTHLVSTGKTVTSHSRTVGVSRSGQTAITSNSRTVVVPHSGFEHSAFGRQQLILSKMHGNIFGPNLGRHFGLKGKIFRPHQPLCYEDSRFFQHGQSLPSSNVCERCICEKGVKQCGQVICVNMPLVPKRCRLGKEAGRCCSTLYCPKKPISML